MRVNVDDDWTAAEDAQLRRFIRDGYAWDDIADTFLRSVTAIQTRAVQLQRIDNIVDEYARRRPPQPASRRTGKDNRLTHPPAPEPQPEPEPQPAKHAGKGTNGTGRTWSVPFRGVCEICGKGIEWDDGPRRRYCSPEHATEANRRRAAERYRTTHGLPPKTTPTPAPTPAPAPVTPLVQTPTTTPAVPPRKARPPVGCRTVFGDLHCCLRRHGGDHLTDNGVIFSRDGKDQWPDINDVYLMAMLNRDMVAPQAQVSPDPGTPRSTPRSHP